MESSWNKSIASLRSGDYSWPDHSFIRSGSSKEYKPTETFGLPIWQGESGKVLVNADFGMGDTIHFWRYFSSLIDQGCDLTLRCDQDLIPLFKDRCISKEDEITGYSYITHMMCLPKFTNDLLLGDSYIEKFSLPEHSWLDHIKSGKIGFCWSGNPYNPRDHLRSCKPDLFRSLGLAQDYIPFGLVKHYKPPSWMTDARPLMENWHTTASLLSYMSLVVSVDTAIAHLAGAIGIPVILLLHKNTDWRWNGTNWYDSMMIAKGDSWEEVFQSAQVLLNDKGF